MWQKTVRMRKSTCLRWQCREGGWMPLCIAAAGRRLGCLRAVFARKMQKFPWKGNQNGATTV